MCLHSHAMGRVNQERVSFAAAEAQKHHEPNPVVDGSNNVSVLQSHPFPELSHLLFKIRSSGRHNSICGQDLFGDTEESTGLRMMGLPPLRF